MRPIERGASPQQGDFEPYRQAFGPLLGRLGPYCSFCERRIATQLAVEHIQPKDDALYPELEGRWENYLLGCVNCNSTKGHKDVRPENFYLPDRDNTMRPFEYGQEGSVVIVDPADKIATDTLALTGLEKTVREVFDENGILVAADRIGQRMEAWMKAERARFLLRRNPNAELVETIIELARSEGFFSVWMTVFHDEPDMRRRFIDAFPGTAQQCFDPATTALLHRPPNGLAAAGKC